MEKQYWLYVESYVYISIKKISALFYNSYSGKILEYLDSPEIVELAKKLNSTRNLRMIKVNQQVLNIPRIREFINRLRSDFMGDLLDCDYSEGKPVQFPPVGKIEKDVKYLKRDKDRSIGEDIMEYFSGLTVYLNNSCTNHCPFCSTAFKQFPCCTASPKQTELNLEQFESFLEPVETNRRIALTVAGGDIFAYSRFDALLKFLSRLSYSKTFLIHSLNAFKHLSELKMLSLPNAALDILITPVETETVESTLKQVVEKISAISIPARYSFIIHDESDFEKMETLASLLSIDDPAIHVFYNGTNRDFFEKYIFIDRETIEAEKPSLKDIYSRQVINSAFFGSLTIRETGQIYSNLNRRLHGNIRNESLYEVLVKELRNGQSWRHTRSKIKPCKDCLYESLCPPVTNYNYVLEQYNLCNMFP